MAIFCQISAITSDMWRHEITVWSWSPKDFSDEYWSQKRSAKDQFWSHTAIKSNIIISTRFENTGKILTKCDLVSQKKFRSGAKLTKMRIFSGNIFRNPQIHSNFPLLCTKSIIQFHKNFQKKIIGPDSN